MGPIIIANFVVCGICLTLAFLYMAVYFRRTERKADFFFAVMSICVALNAYYETRMYRADTIVAFAAALKTQLSFHAILWICFAWFVVF